MHRNLIAGAALGLAVSGYVAAKYASDVFNESVQKSNRDIFEGDYGQSPAMPAEQPVEYLQLGIGA